MDALSAAAIRPATPGDLEALHRLVERTYRSEAARDGWTHELDIVAGPRVTPAALAAALTSPEHRILVAEQGHMLAGSVELVRKAAGLAYLGMLSVDPALQGVGLGRRLVMAAEAEARDRFAAERIEMTVVAPRAALIAWYERQGYVRTGETRPFPDVGPDVRFLTLAPPVMAVLEKTFSRSAV